MILSIHHLKQIIQYSAKRMYFSNWEPKTLDDIYRTTSVSLKPENMYIGGTTNDTICNALWYEMSYNPVRFGTVSPFQINNKNDIIYFNDTYRKNLSRNTTGLLPDEIITLTWQINCFVNNLHKSGLYNTFVKTGTLPQYLSILGADTNYHVISSLRRAIHAIAKQNYTDLQDPDYQEQIFYVATRRHPTGKRSDISYMAINTEFSIKQSLSDKSDIKEQNNTNQQKIIQTCFPFAIQTDTLNEIRTNIVKIKNKMALLEQQIEDMDEYENHVDTSDLRTELRHTKLQYANLCAQEKKLLNKINEQSR